MPHALQGKAPEAMSRMSKGAGLARSARAATGLALAAALASSHTQAREPVNSPMNQTSPRQYCIGRFCFAAVQPLVLAGRSQEIYRVDVKTEALPPKATAASVWAARLAAIRQGKSEASEPGTRSR